MELTGETSRLIVRALQEFTVASDRFIDATGAGHGMHRTDLHALREVLRADEAGCPLTASELGRALGISAPATTALVDRLTSTGHVRRQQSATDRRRIHVVGTDSARSDGWLMFGPLAISLGELVGHYTDPEQALLLKFLTEATERVCHVTP